MALPYIGSRISLITNSDLRYEGTLDAVNTSNSTVTLRDVRMFGTESRKVADPVQPTAQLFEYIVFNGRDIKDLTVCDMPPAAASAVLAANDPAIVNLSPHTVTTTQQHPPQQPQSQYMRQPQMMQQQQQQASQQQQQHHGGGGVDHRHQMAQQGQQHVMGGNNVHGYRGGVSGSNAQMYGGPQMMAAPSQVYANQHSAQQPRYGVVNQQGGGPMSGGMMSYSNQQGHHKQGGGANMHPNMMYSTTAQPGGNYAQSGYKGGMSYGGRARVPNNQANARGGNNANTASGGHSSNVVVGELSADVNQILKEQVAVAFDFETSNKNFNKSQISEEAPKTADQGTASYDKGASFFDNISCETLDKQQGRTGRTDRDAQREIDVATFGQAATMARGPRYYRRGFRRGRQQQRTAGRGLYSQMGRPTGVRGPQSAMGPPAPGNVVATSQQRPVLA